MEINRPKLRNFRYDTGLAVVEQAQVSSLQVVFHEKLLNATLAARPNNAYLSQE